MCKSQHLESAAITSDQFPEHPLPRKDVGVVSTVLLLHLAWFRKLTKPPLLPFQVLVSCGRFKHFLEFLGWANENTQDFLAGLLLNGCISSYMSLDFFFWMFTTAEGKMLWTEPKSLDMTLLALLSMSPSCPN